MKSSSRGSVKSSAMASDLPTANARPLRLTTNPVSSTARATRSRVSCVHLGESLSTRETVDGATPAARATSAMVTRWPGDVTPQSSPSAHGSASRLRSERSPHYICGTASTTLWNRFP